MKFRSSLILGSILGAVLIFVFPIFPVPLPNMVGEFGGIWWRSGFDMVGSSFKQIKEFILIEGVGAATGLLIAFLSKGGLPKE